ncbi:MAG: signal recognition particle protein [Eubacteriales bacterium]|jgi:signal recognition particle subunit SRP54
MAFESLTDKLQNVFRNLRSKGTVTEADVRAAMREVKMALLEADVNFKVVKKFVNTVQEKAVGQDVMSGLNPAQTVIKIVHDELVNLMGPDTTELPLKNANEMTVIMMIGLQGSGKTTTAAKLAGKLKGRGRKPLLVACDVYRPGAIEQLQTNGDRVGVEVFSMGDRKKPVDIAKAGVNHARENGMNVVLIDTAGRLQIDQDMMDELVEIRDAVSVDTTLLVVDAMTGQEAVNVAKTFNDQVGVDGVVLTKLDGDTRGGAALSIRAICGKPIMYAGMGEKMDDLEQFHPDRMASRILGMGDMMSLIEKAQASVDEEKAREMEKRVRKADFTFDDYLTSMEQMRKMGGLSSVLSMLPGMGGKMKDLEGQIDEKQMARTEAIVHSMTPQERANPDLINMSRKQRIAKGAGVDISVVNSFIKQFSQTRKLMKQMPGMMKKGRRRGGMGGMFGGFGGGFPFG